MNYIQVHLHQMFDSGAMELLHNILVSFIEDTLVDRVSPPDKMIRTKFHDLDREIKPVKPHDPSPVCARPTPAHQKPNSRMTLHGIQ